VVDKTTGNKQIAMDTYFVPSVNIWNDSFVDITYPDEIKLPINILTFAQASDEEKNLNMTEVECDTIQNMEVSTLECWRVVLFPIDSEGK
jgi:hypothetical protein